MSTLLLTALLLRRRQRQRHYLMRAALTSPQQSAWRQLCASVDDRSWVNTTGFTRAVVHQLHQRVAQHLTLAPQSSLNTLDVTALTLQYVTSTMKQKQLCQIYGITPAVCSRSIVTGIDAMLAAVRTITQAMICWPTHEEQRQFAMTLNAYTPALHNVFGFVDGVYFPVDKPSDYATADAYYNG